MARTSRPRLIWTSGRLSTRGNQDARLRMRDGQKVEVVGITTHTTHLGTIQTADCIAIPDGALLTVSINEVWRMREEHR